MLEISCSEFEMDSSGVYSFRLIEPELETVLKFGLPQGYVPNNDLTAIAISTLLGKRYDSVNLDLEVSEEARAKLEELIGGRVKARVSGLHMSQPLGGKTGLNFSGGFDSLAAKVLLDEDIELISLDFGGDFARESEFFMKFKPNLISTNLRQKGFGTNSWSFMGIGSILFRDYLKMGTYSFGSILEASAYNVSPGIRYKGNADPWMRAVGLKKLNPVLGLTEVGTAMLLNEFAPHLVQESLLSLAARNSEKFTRKVILQSLAESAVGEHDGKHLYDVTQTSSHQRFGQSFTTDFLLFYILKKAGTEVAEWLVSDIPSNVREATSSLQLDFYERLNPNFYAHMALADSQRIYERCLRARILPYDENDWRELAVITEILSKWHHIPGRRVAPASVV